MIIFKNKHCNEWDFDTSHKGDLVNYTTAEGIVLFEYVVIHLKGIYYGSDSIIWKK